jgi:hypothetical protein
MLSSRQPVRRTGKEKMRFRSESHNPGGHKGYADNIEKGRLMGANFAEASFFRLKGKDVRITYQLTKRGEQLHYEGDLDGERRDLTFRAAEGQIESLEGKIGKLLTVELNPEEAAADAPLVTLTLLLPVVSLEGSESSLETRAVVTTHDFPSLGFDGGPHQRYEIVRLNGTAHQSD